MRKVLSLLLCIAMLCSLIVISANADTGIQLQIADARALPGSSVTVEFNLENNTGMAAWRLDIADDGLGIFTEEAVENGDLYFDDASGLTLQDGNLKNGILVWYGPTNFTGSSMGSLTFKVPDDAELGNYTITLTPGSDDKQAKTADKQVANLCGTTFTVTVTDKFISGVNVAIDANTAIGVHVAATDIDGVTITAVDGANKKYKTVEEYEADEETGDYIFYLNVNPWEMEKDFVIDFTDNFVFNAEEQLDLEQIPATAKQAGILSYCNALLAEDPSDELTQLIADMLAYAQAVQAYKGVAVMDLPDGLTPTVGEWLDGDENPTDFAGYCVENFPTEFTKGNNTAAKKFKFDAVKIDFGAQFVATFTFANNGTTTAVGSARLVIDGNAYQLESDWTYQYAFSPLQYEGIDFVLYASSTTSNTNKCYTTTYGPAYFMAYRAESGEADDLMPLYEAFYNYGVSAAAYVGSLGE